MPRSFITANVADDFYFSPGFCCSELAPDASLGVTGDIIPIAISSKPATQSVHKFKCTHYQVKQKNSKTLLCPYYYSFLNQQPRHTQMCHWWPQEARAERKSCQKITHQRNKEIFSNEKTAKRTIAFNRSVRYKMLASPLIPESFPNSPTTEFPGQFILSIWNYNHLGMCLISKIYCSFQSQNHVWFISLLHKAY